VQSQYNENLQMMFFWCYELVLYRLISESTQHQNPAEHHDHHLHQFKNLRICFFQEALIIYYMEVAYAVGQQSTYLPIKKYFV
jgi:hypothetical protein